MKKLFVLFLMATSVTISYANTYENLSVLSQQKPSVSKQIDDMLTKGAKYRKGLNAAIASQNGLKIAEEARKLAQNKDYVNICNKLVSYYQKGQMTEAQKKRWSKEGLGNSSSLKQIEDMQKQTQQILKNIYGVQ